MQKAASGTVCPAAVLGGEADLLGWLDGKNNGNRKKVASPDARQAAKTPSPTAQPPNGAGSCIEGTIPLAGEEEYPLVGELAL